MKNKVFALGLGLAFAAAVAFAATRSTNCCQPNGNGSQTEQCCEDSGSCCPIDGCPICGK